MRKKKSIFSQRKSFILTFKDVFLMKTRDKEVKSEKNRCAIGVIYDFQKEKPLVRSSCRGACHSKGRNSERSAALISTSHIEVKIN